MAIASNDRWLGPSWLLADTEEILRAALERNGGKLFSDQLYHLYCKHPWLKTCIGSFEKYVSRSSIFMYFKRTDRERPYIQLACERCEELSGATEQCENKTTVYVGKGEHKLLMRYAQRSCFRTADQCQRSKNVTDAFADDAVALSTQHGVQEKRGNAFKGRDTCRMHKCSTWKTSTETWRQKLDMDVCGIEQVATTGSTAAPCGPETFMSLSGH